MQTTTQTSLTFGSVIHTRICHRLASANTLQLLLIVYKVIASILIIAFFFELSFMYEFIIYKGFVFVKTFVFISMVILFDYYRGYIIQFRHNNVPEIYIADETIAIDDQKTNISDVQLSDVINFIYDNGGFPVLKAKELLGLTVNQIKTIGDDLEDIGILIRGVNNARVVNKEINREAIDQVLTDQNISIEDISSSMIQNGSTFTSLSSAISPTY